MIGEPDAGKPHVRFDEGVQETCDSVTRLRPTLRAAPWTGSGRLLEARAGGLCAPTGRPNKVEATLGIEWK